MMAEIKVSWFIVNTVSEICELVLKPTGSMTSGCLDGRWTSIGLDGLNEYEMWQRTSQGVRIVLLE